MPNLINFSQIEQGVATFNNVTQLKIDVEALKTSIEAGKVITTVAKPSDSGFYTVDELLKKIIADATALGLDVTALKNKPVKDRKKLLGKFTLVGAKYESSQFTTTTGVYKSEPVYLYDATTKSPLYKDNVGTITEVNVSGSTPVFPTTVPFRYDIDEHAYVEYTTDVDFSFYPVFDTTLNELPPDFLLDSEEFSIIAFSKVIDEIIARLARDESIVEGIKSKVSDEVINNRIKVVTNPISDRVTVNEGDITKLKTDTTKLKEDTTKLQKDTKDLRTDVDAIKNAVPDLIVNINQAVSLENDLITVKLPEAASSDKVSLFVNGVRYVEENAFDIDGARKVLTWTFTEGNSGFNLLKTYSYEVSYIKA